MIAIRGLRKSFGGRAVLDWVDADLAAGSVHALVGPNGSGKSTLLRVLWGALWPDGGTVELDGRAHDTASPEWKRLVGAVPDDDALIEGLSIPDHFTLCGRLIGLGEPEIASRTAELVRLFDLEEAVRGTRSADEASRGNRKRVACALALLGAPSMLFMDEPYAGLDAERADMLTALMRELASRGLLVLFSCHDGGLVRAAADGYILLEEGKSRSGPASELPGRGPWGMGGLGDSVPWVRC